MAEKKQRKRNRLLGYDYSLPGFYFVTICNKNRVCAFGEIVGEKMVLNGLGEILAKQWLWLAQNFDYIKLDEWVIMPNHVHGIIEIKNENYFDCGTVSNVREGVPVGTILELSLRGKFRRRLPLFRIIGAFKTTSSKLIHQNQGNFHFDWQRSFHDRIIRDEKELINIREYIKNNPVNWQNDHNNPAQTKTPLS